MRWAPFLLLACVGDADIRRPDGPRVEPDSDGSELETDDSETDGDSEEDTDSGDPGPCPLDSVLVGGVCIDRYEARLERWDGAAWIPHSPFERPTRKDRGGDPSRYRAVAARDAWPQGYLSAEEAQAACEASEKRLCTSEEWVRACRGSSGSTWPYGNTYDPRACNDTYGGSHPVVDYFGTSEGVWTGAKMNDPGINQQAGTLTRGGEMTGCASEDGLMDLHGNLHEWVADAEGTFRGGFYADAKINGAGCGYVTTAHSRGYHDYSTGFRCCAAPRE